MKRPNFLVFMTDHQRGDMQPPFGKIITPNLDRLHANGVSFTRAYCPSPHCCPSRATFFSGLYPSEHGVWNNVNVSGCFSRGLFDDVRLFSEDLKDAGYNMYYAGKWHVSAVEGPQHRGFENIHGDNSPRKRFPHLPNAPEWRYYTGEPPGGDAGKAAGKALCDMKSARGEGEIKRHGYPAYFQYGTDENPFNDRGIVEAAVAKLDAETGDTPFFMFVGTNGPHDPYFVPQRFLDMYDADKIAPPPNFGDPMYDKPALYRRTAAAFGQLTEREHRESLRHYYAFCTYEDWLFGLLLDKLEQRGLLGDTVVAYCSDHGDYAGAHGLWAKGLPCFDEAYHVNSVVGFGGVGARSKRVDAFVSLADYAPTFLEMAGIKTDRRFCGASLAPFLRGESPAGWRSEMYTQTNGNEVYGIQRAVFDDNYKYVFNTFDFDELYDLRDDPHEMKNIVGREDMKPVVEHMCRKMWRFAFENRDNAVNAYIMTALSTHGPGIIFDNL